MKRKMPKDSYDMGVLEGRIMGGFSGLLAGFLIGFSVACYLIEVAYL